MKKEVKNCIKYYLENINSDGYKDYEIKRNIQSKEVVREYIEKEKPGYRLIVILHFWSIISY